MWCQHSAHQIVLGLGGIFKIFSPKPGLEASVRSLAVPTQTLTPSVPVPIPVSLLLAFSGCFHLCVRGLGAAIWGEEIGTLVGVGVWSSRTFQ